jgi:mannonate dehydratase
MEDLNFIINSVPNKSNGICFCTGSFGADPNNNLPEMVKQLGSRIHFTHLRNTKRDAEGNFFEDDHLSGDTDMYAVMKELLLIQKELPHQICFRPDHGHQMLDDLNKITNPGYSAIGRLRGLAELRGLQLGILRSMN